MKLDMRVKRNIIFTGGGSGGHVMPTITLISKLKKDFLITYIGSKNGIESKIISEHDIPYYGISTGKLRRYFSWENFKDFFRFIKGILDAYRIFSKYTRKSTLLFSTGGFVTVPVVLAASLRGIPIFIHEQTSQVGLANKIASIFAKIIFISFKSSKKFFPEKKVVFSGYPLRDECFTEVFSKNVICGIDLKTATRPILFITGGGNGSKLLNDLVKNEIDELKKKYLIFHQVGSSYENEYKEYNDENYHSFAFLKEGMIDLFKSAQIVISRAGAGTVCELLALKKRSIFIPLKIAQKNEQYHNAMEASQRQNSLVIREDDLREVTLCEILSRFDGGQISGDSVDEIKNGTESIIRYIEKHFRDC